MSLLQNSNAISAGGYDINNSLRFRSSASAYLSRTPTSNGNRQTWTWSAWVKRGQLGAYQVLFGAGLNNNVNADELVSIYFTNSDQLGHYVNETGVADRNNISTAVFRDPSAWYHIVAVYDSTNATAANRQRLYVNGVQITSWSATSIVSQNYQPSVNSTAYPHAIGKYGFNSTRYLDGYMAEVNFIDGQALTPSSFGETDTDTGTWKAKRYTGTYGTNGFYLPFKSYTDTAYAGQFNGSTQYLTVAGNTAFDLTGDFTIESWINPSSLPNPTGIWSLQPASGGAGIRCTYEGQLLVALISGVGTLHAQLSGPVLTSNNWYHVAVTRSGSALKLFVNGCVVATQTTSGWTGTSSPCMIGAARNYASGAMFYYTGYQSNFRIVKGTALYTSNFVPPTSQLTNISGTSILTLQNSSAIDNSSNAFTITNNGTTTFLGNNVIFNANVLADASLTGSSWTPNNLNYSFYGTTYDAMTDSPTLTSATVANYAVGNPLYKGSSLTISNANLTMAGAGGTYNVGMSTISLKDGKYYCEFTLSSADGSTYIGICTASQSLGAGASSYLGNSGSQSYGYYEDGRKRFNTTLSAYGSSYTTGDIIGIAYDGTAGTLTYYKNGTSQGTAFTGIDTTVDWFFAVSLYAGNGSFNFGQRPFSYTPPTGYKALNTYNLPDSTIKKGNKYMDATLYTGNGGTQSVVNAVGFKPDFVWTKPRSIAYSHLQYNSISGAGKYLQSNNTNAEGTLANTIISFNSNGFTVGVDDNTNGTVGATGVAWQWQAGQGSTSSNTSGSITSTVSVNATAGFSVATFTGTGANATVGHGLGVTPKMTIIKKRSTTGNWIVGHIGATNWNWYLTLNSTAAQTGDATMIRAQPDTSVVYLGTNTDVNASTATYVMYNWAEIAGFSKFTSFVGNGSTDGPFVYLGFRPKYILLKGTNITQWIVEDSSRSTYNVSTIALFPNLSDAEQTNRSYIDFLSNGFKLKDANADSNASGVTYIVAAFAENPFKNANAR